MALGVDQRSLRRPRRKFGCRKRNRSASTVYSTPAVLDRGDRDGDVMRCDVMEKMIARNLKVIEIQGHEHIQRSGRQC